MEGEIEEKGHREGDRLIIDSTSKRNAFTHPVLPSAALRMVNGFHEE